MYNLLNAKLLILPDWLSVALEAYNKTPRDIITREGLESILSATDVEFYLKQCSTLSSIVSSESGSTPVQVVLDSLKLLHTNSFKRNLGNNASGLNEYVKLNTLYGKNHAGYDFFNGSNMLGYLPRSMGASLESCVIVDPYVEAADVDLYALKFTTGFYQQDAVQQFIKNTLTLLMGTYGFDEVSQTMLFDYYAIMPNV